MATERLVIVVDERGARVVKRNLEDVGKSAKQSEGGVRLLRRALGLLVTGATVRALVQTADQFTNIENRIRLVTESTSELNRVTDDLLQITQRRRSHLRADVVLFNPITLATKDLGTSQQEVLNFTESLNQAIKISGASAAEASAGVIQLSQGLASGTLRGDELRSVLEQLPFVADVIAKDLGITRGELRLFGQEGKINAEVVTTAFRNAREEIAERFQTTVGTTAEAFITLRNAATVAFGRFAQAADLSSSLATSINSLTMFIEDNVGQFQNLGRALSGTLDPSDNLTEGFQQLATAIIIIQQSFRILVSFLKSSVTTAFETVGNQLGGVAAAIGLALEGEFSLAGQTIAESFTDTRDIIITNALDLQEDLVGSTTDTIEALTQVWDEGARTIQDRQDQIFNVSSSDSPITPTAVDPAVQKLIESQEKLLADLLLQEQALVSAAATGREYNVVLEEMETNAIAAQTGQQGLAFDINATREEIRRLNSEQANQDFLDNLQLQNDALNEAVSSGRDFNEVMDEFLIRQQFIADSRGLQEALDLTEANNLLREQLENSQDGFRDFLTRARENAQDILGEALGDVFTGGLDEIPAKFASVLADLASQFFASEIFKALGNIGGGVGGGGGILSAIGGFFAGGFQGGGQFQVPGSGGPDSIPTLLNLSPRETVTVTPPGQQPMGQMPTPIVNVSAPPVVVVDSEEKAQKFLQTPQGEEGVLNILQRNPDAVRSVTGA